MTSTSHFLKTWDIADQRYIGLAGLDGRGYNLMPYISPERRTTQTILHPATSGDLNYAITSVINGYMRNFTHTNYGAINDVLGALEGAKMEFYRRVAAPYENKKIVENGDLY